MEELKNYYKQKLMEYFMTDDEQAAPGGFDKVKRQAELVKGLIQRAQTGQMRFAGMSSPDEEIRQKAEAHAARRLQAIAGAVGTDISVDSPSTEGGGFKVTGFSNKGVTDVKPGTPLHFDASQYSRRQGRTYAKELAKQAKGLRGIEGEQRAKREQAARAAAAQAARKAVTDRFVF